MKDDCGKEITIDDFKLVERDGGWGYSANIELCKEYNSLEEAQYQLGRLKHILKKGEL